MSPLRWFLFVYIFGGLTFIPLILAALAAYIYYTSILVSLEEREKKEKAKVNDPAEITRPNDEKLIFKSGTDDLEEKFHRKHDSDVAAGWFAVCREYVPGGVNGRPPDKLSPAGEVVANESPSVYQTMYRSIFDRNQKATIEPGKDGAGKTVKRPNNVFYVVLRHGHLMLYDDVQQLDVRYVISLDYHDVDLYGGSDDEDLAEGELWTKRNAIRLRRKDPAAGDKKSLPFFLFGESLSEKEDLYHALLKSQEGKSDDVPQAEDFDVKHIVGLMQKLHSSEEQLQTRWLNAMIGRMFLALYKTPELEAFIRAKLEKKISKVKKPTFITRLSLLKIDTGTSGPFITNPRLKDLTVNGDCMVEVDVEYTGHFRLEVGATARIDLGKRFNAREVDMVLAVTVKRMQGHALARFKPPPSNRIWFTFEKMPTIDITVEPIVSSRQITYSIILRQIESRIREVVAESVVLPFWDDIPFLKTEGQKYRGGIWKREKHDATPTEIQNEEPEDEAEAGMSGSKTPDTLEMMKKSDRNFSTLSMPNMHDDPNRPHPSQKSSASLAEYAPSKKDLRSPARTPRILRAPSFPTPVDPKLTANHADTDSGQQSGSSTPKRDSAALSLKDLSARATPPGSSSGSPPFEGSLATAMKDRSASIGSKGSRESMKTHSRQSTTDVSADQRTSSRPTTPSLAGDGSRPASLHEDMKQKTLTQQAKWMTHAEQRKQAIASATAVAQKWSTSMNWGVLAKKKGQGPVGVATEQEPSSPAPDGTASAPMGRGQPLPPPGQPLPRPPKATVISSISSMVPKRKHMLPQRAEDNGSVEAGDLGTEPGSSKPSPKVAPPLPDRRRRQSSRAALSLDNDEDDVLVVEAPTESAPSSPAARRNRWDELRDDFFGHDVDHTSEEPTEIVHKPPIPPRNQDAEVPEPSTATRSKPRPPALPQRQSEYTDAPPAYAQPASSITGRKPPPDLPPRTPTSPTAPEAPSPLSHSESIKRKPLSRTATINSVKGAEIVNAEDKADTNNPWTDPEHDSRPLSPHASEAVNSERTLRMMEGASWGGGYNE